LWFALDAIVTDWRIVDGHCPLPLGTATGAFFIGTHQLLSDAYPLGHDPVFASEMALASSTQQMIVAFIFRSTARPNLDLNRRIH
jgi:hypothetical protein